MQGKRKQREREATADFSHGNTLQAKRSNMNDLPTYFVAKHTTLTVFIYEKHIFYPALSVFLYFFTTFAMKLTKVCNAVHGLRKS